MKRKTSAVYHFLSMLILSAAALVFSACGKTNEAAAGKRIICTTYPVFLFSKTVMEGSPVQPELLLPADTGCPHDYSLTPGDLMKLSGKNVLLLQNGLGLDNMICSVAKKTNPQIQISDLSYGAHDLLKTEAEEHEKHAEHEEHEKHHHHHAESEYNPHLFASPDTAQIMVKNAVKAICEFDPDHSAIYEKNGKLFLSQLESLTKEFRNAGLKDRKIAVQHDVFAYLARLTGMDEEVSLHAEESQALSPAAIAELRKEIQKENVTVLYAEPQYSREIAEMIAKEAGIRYEVLDPCASGPATPENGYYIQVMKNNLRILRANGAK